MLRIAICDDDEQQLRQTENLVSAYLRARPGAGGQVESFGSGGALLARAEAAGGFDLYVLDILMPELSGIDTGRRLRALGEGGEIVYLTASNEFAADSYDVRAFFYLLKPVQADKFFRVLDGAAENLARRRGSCVVVPTAEGPRRIPLDRIRYVERVGRCMRYYCTDGTVDSHTIRSPFREMAAPLLAHRRFCLCGASFVLNFQHVTGVNGQTVLLDDGRTMTLPRRAAAEFKRAWGSYWLEEEHGL
ncbi:MAG TPA: LytTR family DNA-binding domain-containing protein [Candidatus Fournierella merdipullorum]|uniref:Stage 0 sporulation protein A homolog n=1 Tax=Candidatus Allofournierella merdipullorum TaxID=2838595 RepID=A0A9D2E4M4_9FIRM|nr:LytTR family DNA-binding domain-containing protein [Candidatus Fournierella merdipullorum]